MSCRSKKYYKRNCSCGTKKVFYLNSIKELTHNYIQNADTELLILFEIVQTISANTELLIYVRETSRTNEDLFKEIIRIISDSYKQFFLMNPISFNSNNKLIESEYFEKIIVILYTNYFHIIGGLGI